MRFSSLLKTPCYVVAFCVSSFTISAQSFAQDITSNLIGHWTLDETTGATFLDSSGNSLSGYASGGLSANNDSIDGIVYSAIDFDGVNDQIMINHDAILELDNTTGTVAAWVRPNTSSIGQNQIIPIFWKQEHTNTFNSGGYALQIHQGGSSDPMYLAGRFGGSRTKDSTTPFSANTWYHVAMTWDGTNVYLYVDGKLVNTGAIPGTIQYLQNAPARIGHATGYDGGTDYARAAIDDVRVYSRTLSSADIYSLYTYRGIDYDCKGPYGLKAEMIYNDTDRVMQYCDGNAWRTIGAPFISAFADDTYSDVTSGLISYWTMDETTGTTVVDSIGGNDGTIQTFTAAEMTTTGKIGAGLEFNGSNNYITIQDLNSSDILTTYSTSMWFKLSSAGTLYHRGTSSGCSYNPRITISDTQINYRESGCGGLNSISMSTTDILDDQWHHIATVRDGSTFSLYVDGTLRASDTISSGGSFSSASREVIGAGYSSSTNSYSSTPTGVIDDLRVYNRALTANEIRNLAQTSNVVQWNMDDTTGTTSTASDVAYNLTYNGGTISANNETSPISGNLLTFDGVDDYLTGAQSINSLPVTIMGWVYFDSFTMSAHNPIFLSSYVDSNTYCGIQISSWGGPSGDGTVSIQNGDCLGGGPENRYSLATYGALQAQQWNHVAVVINAYNDVAIYVNGAAQPIDNTTGTATSISFNSSATTRFGYPTPNYTPYLDGKLDDWRIYNVDLSAEKIREIYEETPQCSIPEEQPLAYWSLDETTGASITDSSGNSNSGTWTDGSGADVAEETQPGKVGTSLLFDGDDDVITVPTGSAFDFSSGYTISGWFYFDSTDSHPVWPSIVGINTGSGWWGSGFILGRSSAGGNVIGGRIRLLVAHDRQFNADYYDYTGWIFPVDTWQHITVTWNGTNLIYYLNGEIVSSDIILYPPDTSSGDLTIGYGRSNGYNGYFKGGIDDLRIHQRALNQSEVQQLYGASGGECLAAVRSCSDPFGYEGEIVYNTSYNVMQFCNGDTWQAMGRPGDGGSTCSNPNATAGEMYYHALYNTPVYCEGDEWVAMGPLTESELPTDGLVYHWPLDDISGTSVSETVSSTNGTISGSNAATMTTAGVSGTALTFDGNNDVIKAPASGGSSSVGSVSLWMKTTYDEPTQIQMLWMGCGSCVDGFGADNEMHMFLDVNENFGFFIESGSDDVRTSYVRSLNDGEWHHLVATWSFSGDVVMYIDGEMVKTITNTVSSTFTFTGGQVIGRQNDSTAIDRQFNGSIDEVRYYNRVLTSDEVAVIYSLESP